MVVTVTRSRVGVARALAEMLLVGLPDRWAHTVGVAARAAELSVTVVPDDRDLLVVAAWLHDIGYSPRLRDSGFHSLDGARYLDRQGWPPRVAALVAHHSGAVFAADVLGLRDQVDRYPRERSPVADALANADQTVGPTGQRLALRERMADMLSRHGPDSVQAQVHHLRGPYLIAVADRVEQRLRAVATPVEAT